MTVDAPAGRFVCVHGHFYQPPREQAWLEAIETQDSARPYHDWNERILAECYAPNSDCRILDPEGRIARIVNNYASISFNFGPTLLGWLESHAPDTYRAILDADRLSADRFDGHGSALAQAYHHAILPLCNQRDRRTQVRWGVADFRRRFGREPAGLWLPETAVDLATLEAVADEGIRFTILAPSQAARSRRISGGRFRSVAGERIDSRVPYRVFLPGGASIDLFFYDAAISRGIAFEQLLARGDELARRLIDSVASDDPWPLLAHVATDGESYGHHHTFGEMALAVALERIEQTPGIELTNYARFLELRPPTEEVELHEPSAWSCAHGVGRWAEDCGCSSGSHAGWTQAWRAPLRAALDDLRDRIEPLYERRGGELFHDPWSVRDAYVELLLSPGQTDRERFLATRAGIEPGEARQVEALRLLELQRHAMLMYTSCGWFFDEVSGIETLQILQYAGRAAELADLLFGTDLEVRFVEQLEKVPSNVPEIADGRALYERRVRPSRVDLAKVGANHAAAWLFDGLDVTGLAPAYEVACEERVEFTHGGLRMVAGRLRVVSRRTAEAARLTFAFAHLGGHNLNGGVRAYQGETTYRQMLEATEQAVSGADVPTLLKELDRHFLNATYSLPTLFRDLQLRVLERVLASTLDDATDVYRRLYERHAPLMQFLAGLELPMPAAFGAAGGVVMNAELHRELATDAPDAARLTLLADRAGASGVALDDRELGFAARTALERLVGGLTGTADELPLLEHAAALASWIRGLGFHVDLRAAENRVHRLSRTDRVQALRETADPAAAAWIERFSSFEETLGLASPAAVTDSR